MKAMSVLGIYKRWWNHFGFYPLLLFFCHFRNALFPLQVSEVAKILDSIGDASSQGVGAQISAPNQKRYTFVTLYHI